MNNSYYDQLLTRYFSGELTPDDEVKLQDWLKASPGNQEMFEEMEKLWKNADPPETPTLPEIEQEWLQLEEKIEIKKQEEPTRPHQPWEDRKPLPYPKRRRARNWQAIATIAAVFLIVFSAYFWKQFTEKSVLREITAQNGQKVQIDLPDGSHVQLNSGSSIQFLEKFTESQRLVILSGEAFFEVEHDREKPFLVQTDHAVTQVLGTEFNVWARDEQTRVIVQKGRVALRSTGLDADEGVILTGGEMSLCRKGENPEAPTTVDAEFLLGWLDGKIIFNKTQLREVVDELERFYNIPVQLAEPSLSEETITGTFYNKPLESVLSSISLTLDLNYKFEQNRYILSKSR